MKNCAGDICKQTPTQEIAEIDKETINYLKHIVSVSLIRRLTQDSGIDLITGVGEFPLNDKQITLLVRDIHDTEPRMGIEQIRCIIEKSLIDVKKTKHPGWVQQYSKWQWVHLSDDRFREILETS